MIEKARRYRKIIETLTEHLDDETAISTIDLFPHWNNNKSYKIDDRVQFNNILYKCLLNHTSQESWNPENAPSLWTRVLIPDPEIIPEWIQPDSTNPYMKGDKVKHNGKTWESIIDNNVWQPGAIGTETLWIEI